MKSSVLSLTALCLQAYLLRAVCQKMQQGLPAPRALTEAFLVTNSHLRCMQSSFYSGSTATVAMVDGHRIICANAGDSPAFVVSKSGVVAGKNATPRVGKRHQLLIRHAAL